MIEGAPFTKQNAGDGFYTLIDCDGYAVARFYSAIIDDILLVINAEPKTCELCGSKYHHMSKEGKFVPHSTEEK